MYNLAHIRTLAEKKKLKIKEVFQYAGITDPGLRNSIEKQTMSLKTLDKLAELFDVSISELIADSRLKVINEDKIPIVNEGVYKKLVSTQEDLIQKQEILYNTLEKENRDLKKQIEELKNEVKLGNRYNVAAEPSTKLKK